VLVLLIQSGLIGWLLIERRRRRLAEQAVQKQHLELVHACHIATAGELTLSIAHEVKQPLGAILSNADAADLLLDGGTEVGRRSSVRSLPTSAATTGTPAKWSAVFGTLKKNWGWLLPLGIVSIVLGGIIVAQWPVSGLWVIGLFVAVELIFHGWSYVFVALAARKAGGAQLGSQPQAA
jgi:hypothetical protein